MIDDIQNWVVNWLVDNSDISEKKIHQELDSNYLQKDWLDSLKFILFIADVEEHFKIKFSNDEFQNRKFATTKGLTEIINAKLS